MIEVRLKERIGIFSLRSTGQTISRYNDTGKFWFQAEFWYLLGLLYSFIHTNYTFKMMTI